MRALHSIPREPEIGFSGLPLWAEIALDGVIGCGEINWSAFDGLSTDELLDVARRLVRAQHVGVDVAVVLEEVAK